MGISRAFHIRLHSHSEREWFQEVVDIKLDRHPNRASAIEAERVAIETECPRYNVQHNRAFYLVLSDTQEQVIRPTPRHLAWLNQQLARDDLTELDKLRLQLTPQERSELFEWEDQPYRPFSEPHRYGGGPQPKLKPWPGWSAVRRRIEAERR